MILQVLAATTESMRDALHVPTGSARSALRGVALAILVLPFARPALAEVEVVVRPDGSRWVRSVTSADGPAPAAKAGPDAAAPVEPAVRRAGPVQGAQPSGVRFASRTVEVWPASSGTAAPAPAVRRAPVASDPAAAPARPVDLDEIVAAQAAAHGLDPALVHAVIRAESAGNRLAVSRVGAMGLMQLMPATAAELAVADPWDETENVRGGAAYLRRMLDRFERLDLALAAYNAGPSAVERHDAVPPYRETVDYVRRVLGTYHGRPVPLSEIRVAASYVPPRPRAGRAAGSSPVLVRDASGRLHLTNAGR